MWWETGAIANYNAKIRSEAKCLSLFFLFFSSVPCYFGNTTMVSLSNVQISINYPLLKFIRMSLMHFRLLICRASIMQFVLMKSNLPDLFNTNSVFFFIFVKRICI